MSLENISLRNGNYVVAVSGGVDSVVLLHLLSSKLKSQSLKLVIAHADHGMRTDSAEDAAFVKTSAEKYGLPSEVKSFELGAEASEAAARAVRYEFLQHCAHKYKAQIVTAHHQDDLLETAIINILRGTGPHGLSGMLRNTELIRPLLAYSKAEILAYAKENGLTWHEDSSNTDQTYLRNYVRATIIPRLTSKRHKLLELIEATNQVTLDIDEELSHILKNISHENVYKRSQLLYFDFQKLSYLVRQILLDHEVSNINRKLIERTLMAIKTLPVGKIMYIDGRHCLQSHKEYVEFVTKSHP